MAKAEVANHRPESLNYSENMSDFALDGSTLEDQEDSMPPSRDEVTGEDLSRAGGLFLVMHLKSQALTFPLAWVPGQGVQIDYAAIIDILIVQLDSESKSLLSD